MDVPRTLNIKDLTSWSSSHWACYVSMRHSLNWLPLASMMSTVIPIQCYQSKNILEYPAPLQQAWKDPTLITLMPIASQVLFHTTVNHQYTKILYCTTTKATLQLLWALTQGESFPDQTSCLRPVPNKCCQDGCLPASHWERWCITTTLPRLQSPNYATLNDRQAGQLLRCKETLRN